MQKLESKSCDLIVLNGPAALHGPDTVVEILDRQGQIVAEFAGGKDDVGRQIFAVIGRQLLRDRI